MEWLNPRAFWLLPLIGVLFLFARRRALDQRWVGNLYLWANSAPPDPSQLAVRRLRRHWLIALQAGVMLAAITALAHPVSSVPARRVTFIVDVSASMGARDGTDTRLSLAVARAMATAATLPSAVRVRVIAAGPAPIDRGEFPSSGVAAALGALAPTDAAADLVEALNDSRARDAADEYVFTDQPAPPAMPVDTAHWVRVGRAADNLAITALSAALLPGEAARAQALITVHNFGSTPRASGLELLHGTTVLARESFSIAAGAGTSITLALHDVHGVIHARLTTDDALAFDNQRWAIVPAATPVRVRLLTHGSPFLEKALTANRALAVVVDKPADLDAAARDAVTADVLVCDGCRAVPARWSAALVIPPAPSDKPKSLDNLTLSGSAHPVTEAVDFTGLAAGPLPRIPGAADGEILARAGSAPALVASERDGQRVVELNLDLSSSTLPLSVSFPLLLANVIGWLADGNQPRLTAVAGDPLVWTRANAPDMADATGPDGRPITTHAIDRVLTITDTSAAGVYRVRSGGTVREFVVNPATLTESDLSTPRDDTPGAPMLMAQAAPPPGNESVAWPSALLIVALLLLAIEWRQFCRGAR